MALLARCSVVPRARLEAALDRDQPTFVQVGARELGGFAKRDQVVKLGQHPGRAVLGLAGVGVGGDAHRGYVSALLRRADLRVRRQVTDQKNLVHFETPY